MKKEAKFKPKAGQVDYSKIRWAPVINCVLTYKGKILVVERSAGLRHYPGYWNGIGGYLDDNKNLKDKVLEELREELGLAKKSVRSIKLGAIFDQEEPTYKKTWIVHPVLVKVATDKVRLDWEAQNYRWVTVQEAKKLKLLPGFDQVLKNLFK